MLGLDEKDLVSGPKPDDLELVECHEDWSHTGTPQWACSEDNPRAGDSSEAPPHGWSKCPRSKPPMRLRTLCRPWAASWAREEEPEEREGLRRGGAPRRSDARRPSTSPNLADPALPSPQGACVAQVPAAAHAHQPAAEEGARAGPLEGAATRRRASPNPDLDHSPSSSPSPSPSP